MEIGDGEWGWGMGMGNWDGCAHKEKHWVEEIGEWGKGECRKTGNLLALTPQGKPFGTAFLPTTPPHIIPS